MNTLQPHLSDKKHIIWDWNGTLLDDVDYAVSTIGQLLRENDLAAIDREAYLEKFGFPVFNYYQTLGFNFEKTPFAVVAERFIEIYNESVHRTTGLFSGVNELLADLRGQGLAMSILSAAHETPLREILTYHAIDRHFDHIHGLRDNFATSKVQRGHELIAKIHIPKEEIIMVGDTDHDAEVAEALGIDILILADGHQKYERLVSLADKPHVRAVLPSRYLRR